MQKKAEGQGQFLAFSYVMLDKQAKASQVLAAKL